MKLDGRFAKVAWVCAIAGLAASTASVACLSPALADEATESYKENLLVTGVRYGEILKEFEDAFFSHDRTFYGNRAIPGQIKYLIGPFPDVDIAKDGKDVNKVYQEVLYRQMNAGPIIRTVDLPTPFPFSLRTLPAPIVAAPIDVLPSPIIPAPPSALPGPTQRPVPALW
jgi:hypothetical protein